jgi:hypothetical protein
MQSTVVCYATSIVGSPDARPDRLPSARSQAEAALDTLNKKDIGEAKSLKKPPPGVDDITAVVIILLEGNPKDKSWAAAQKLMSNVDKFMERLKMFKSACSNIL